MAPYGEYFDRSQWNRSERLHLWVARSTLKEFLRITKIDPKTSSILEIGAGLGRGAIAAQSLGFQSYEGVEPTEKLADFVRRSTQQSIANDSLPHLVSHADGQFDAVFSIHVLEHANDPEDARAWCKEMLRVTKGNGYVLVAAPNIMDYQKHFWNSDWTHKYPTTPQRVEQIFNSLGVEVVFAGNLHLGKVSGLSALLAHFYSFFLPTRVGDLITEKYVGRPLVSGLKIAALWGLAFVVAKKPAEDL